MRRTRSDSRHGRAAVLALGVVAAGLLGWLLLSTGGGEPSAPPLLPAPELASGKGRPDAVELEAGPLPGSGPLHVRLHSLGGSRRSGVVAVRGGSLQGRILDSRGEGIPAVHLRVIGGPQEGVRARSGDDGSYTVPDLLPGTQYFILEAPGHPPVARLQQVLANNPTHRDFVIGDAVPLDFLVRDHEGEPLAGAQLSLDLGARRTRTDENGIAAFPSVVSGPRVLLDVIAADHVPVRHELNVLPIRTSDDPVELPPLPLGGTIRGEVPSYPGPPRPRVTVVPLVNRPTGHHVIWETWHGVQVDEEGHFRLENLPLDQTVDLRVFHPRGLASPPVRTIKPGTYVSSVKFIVRPVERNIAGRVVDERGEPVARAEVLLEAEDPVAVLASFYQGLASSPHNARLPIPAPVRRTLLTGRDGSFSFTYGDHPEGSGGLILSASKPGYSPDRTAVRRARGDIELRLEKIDETARFVLEASDGGPLPEQTPVWFLDGQQIGVDQELHPGWYRAEVWRGETFIKRIEEIELRGRTKLPVR